MAPDTIDPAYPNAKLAVKSKKLRMKAIREILELLLLASSSVNTAVDQDSKRNLDHLITPNHKDDPASDQPGPHSINLEHTKRLIKNGNTPMDRPTRTTECNAQFTMSVFDSTRLTFFGIVSLHFCGSVPVRQRPRGVATSTLNSFGSSSHRTDTSTESILTEAWNVQYPWKTTLVFSWAYE
jgi:hypothetical protein